MAKDDKPKPPPEETTLKIDQSAGRKFKRRAAKKIKKAAKVVKRISRSKRKTGARRGMRK